MQATHESIVRLAIDLVLRQIAARENVTGVTIRRDRVLANVTAMSRRLDELVIELRLYLLFFYLIFEFLTNLID